MVFVFAPRGSSTLCLVLSPVALAIVFWYSLAKRDTTYTQLFLGLAMAVAPVGGWIAAGGRGGVEPWLLGLAIGLWVGGFDILYACQDVEFDRGHGLRSIPARFGVAAAIRLSRLMHVGAVVAMAALWRAAELPALYLGGVAIVAVLLVYEQSLVSDDDLSQVKKAFDLNGYVGIVYFVATALALYVGYVAHRHATPRRTSRRDRIAGMFDAIAPRYDLLNHLLSAGIDRRWRRRAIASLQLTGRETLVDVCTGTADVALEAAAWRRRASSAWISPARCWRSGLQKVRAAGEASASCWCAATRCGCPAPTACADAATVAFGIRNVQRPEVACAEMARVLRPGGRLAILEFGVPRIPGVSALYLWYFRHVLPLVGRLISGTRGAYSYLPASVGTFPPPAEFMTLLRQAGFAEVRAVPLTFGIVYLYTAVKAQSGVRALSWL